MCLIIASFIQIFEIVKVRLKKMLLERLKHHYLKVLLQMIKHNIKKPVSSFLLIDVRFVIKFINLENAFNLHNMS